MKAPKPITFKQWRAEKRRYQNVTIERPAPVAEMALEAQHALGGFFSLQRVQAGQRIALGFFVGDGCIASEVCKDDHSLALAVDGMVMRVHATIKAEAA